MSALYTAAPRATRRWQSIPSTEPYGATRRMLEALDDELVDYIGYWRTLRAAIDAPIPQPTHRRVHLREVESTIRCLFRVRHAYFRAGWR